MLNFILNMAIMNMLGGRWNDVMKNSPISGRMLWRCITPGIAAMLLGFNLGFGVQGAFYLWFAVTLGSAMWYPFGWSFTEQHGVNDPSKYANWVRWIGYKLFPSNVISTSADKKRAIVMKGIRGMYDVLTFALLLVFSPYAMLFWLGTFAMGAVYWLLARITPGATNDVLTAEFAYGAWRGLMIGLAITF